MPYETDERVAELTDRLENGVKELYASDSYAQYISAMAKFHHASFELAWTNFDRPCKRISLSSVQPGRIHPTQKPIALYAWIFEHFARPGDRILDTHLGSGSSRIAAYDAGLDFTGYEIDGDYFAAQEKRFAAHVREHPF